MEGRQRRPKAREVAIMPASRCLAWTLLVLGAGVAPLLLAAGPTGWQPEVRVRQPTRLTWGLPLDGLPAEQQRLLGSYLSSKQRYQLYVPPDYDPGRPWPLLLFLAPGDDPLGFSCCKKAVEQQRMLFCAAYGAGPASGPAQSCRIVLDVFDDVRRRYSIDPDQTYLVGFSGAARLACELAFAFPEYVGGVVAVCGCGEWSRLDYLRLLARERMSLALITGPDDLQRREVEDFCYPYFTDLGIRTRLWKPPGSGHSLPSPELLNEVVLWLQEDLARRRAWDREWPTLAIAAEEVPTDLTHAGRMLQAAAANANNPEKVFRSVALVRGILARYGRTEPAERAERLLREIQDDPRRRKWLQDVSAEEEKRQVMARARAQERSGDLRGASRSWQPLALRAGTPEGTLAAREMTRLHALLAGTPYLGLGLEGDSSVVQSVVAEGPADRAGLRSGDRLLKLGPTTISSLTDLRKILDRLKPGDKVPVALQRGEKMLTLELEVGRPPS
jgi:hypothetical protein